MANLHYLVLLLGMVYFCHASGPESAVTKNTGMEKFQPCNPSKDKNECPTGSSCVDNGTMASYCVCSSNFTVNAEYKSGKDYCVKKNETEPTPDNSVTAATTEAGKTEPNTKAPPTTPTSSKSTVETTTTTLKAPSSTAKSEPSTAKPDAKKQDESTEAPKTDDIKIAPVPTHHHILGGIFIPTFLVLGFICGAFAIKKYNLIEKAHELIRNRNHQQRYNGLMENEFDDDDPLLI